MVCKHFKGIADKFVCFMHVAIVKHETTFAMCVDLCHDPMIDGDIGIFGKKLSLQAKASFEGK